MIAQTGKKGAQEAGSGEKRGCRGSPAVMSWYSSSWLQLRPTHHPPRWRSTASSNMAGDGLAGRARFRMVGKLHAAVASIVSPASAKESGADPVAKTQASLPFRGGGQQMASGRGETWPRLDPRLSLVLPVLGDSQSATALGGRPQLHQGGLGSVLHSTLASARVSRRIEVGDQDGEPTEPRRSSQVFPGQGGAHLIDPWMPANMAAHGSGAAGLTRPQTSVYGIRGAPARPRAHPSLFSRPVVAGRRAWLGWLAGCWLAGCWRCGTAALSLCCWGKNGCDLQPGARGGACRSSHQLTFLSLQPPPVHDSWASRPSERHPIQAFSSSASPPDWRVALLGSARPLAMDGAAVVK